MHEEGNRNLNLSRPSIALAGCSARILDGLISTCLLILILIPVSGCMTEEAAGTESATVIETPRTITIIPSVRSGTEWPESIVLLYFDTEGLQELESIETITPVQETIQHETCKEGLIITGLGNFPYEIDRSKLTRYESVEQMKAKLGDDDPSRPVMSGECWSEGCDTVILRLTPLLCRVRLTRVDNMIGGNTLLEEPLISLKGAMTEAELMRHSGFRPVSNIEGEISVKLDNDIGSAPVFPDVSLYCYPYDDAGQEVGCPPVMMCFSCTVDGEVIEWSFGLPPLRRNSTLEVSLIIEGKDKFSYCCQ